MSSVTLSQATLESPSTASRLSSGGPSPPRAPCGVTTDGCVSPFASTPSRVMRIIGHQGCGIPPATNGVPTQLGQLRSPTIPGHAHDNPHAGRGDSPEVSMAYPPVLPNPPRVGPSMVSTSSHSAWSTRTKIPCARRSPRRTRTGAAPKLYTWHRISSPSPQ